MAVENERACFVPDTLRPPCLRTDGLARSAHVVCVIANDETRW
ncbi:hypothetical protein GGD68_004272 [Paraburkholderia fungorum]|jgi:hypothetical protein|uniref:Uncharacterized protein n=1 Tax=Paraburkholderia fungorum TaxID=134537 RepID=A0AAW3V2R5_9BURK|nr:hypothetical protein [Paraburkholderia fungorum]MBB6203431.1 hypothetical protein [Paraburkholderia fungorum]